MSMFHLIYAIWGLSSLSCFIVVVCASWCPYQIFQQTNQRFQQKTEKFWVFSQQTQTWVEAKLPYDLLSCVNGDCRKVGSILQTEKETTEQVLELEHKLDEQKKSVENNKDSNMEAEDVVLPQRKRISLIKISETSVWITGQSGSIYERFWNGMEWVNVPHDLPVSAGHAISVFVINQTILALSESGNLYQIQVQYGESSQPVWVELTPTDEDKNLLMMKSGVASHDGGVYFCTKKGTLVELAWVEPPRWINHGQPAGANLTAIADAASTREVVYTISSAGDLYEYDRKSKPSWKRHIWQERKAQAAPLMPSKGCSVPGLSGDHSESLFLLTKEGTLVERRLHQRKWKWVVHGSLQDQNLTSITPALQDESSETSSISLFFTTSYGSVFEYRIPKQLGLVPNNQFPGAWKNHQHPLHAKAARGISGLQLYSGRILFPLDDGRLAELHPLGLGGESSGPSQPQSIRRKASTKYVWSILDVPESEGWNAEYCTEERGPNNCLTGITDESEDSVISLVSGSRRKQNQAQNHYLSVGASGGRLIQSSEEYNTLDNWISGNFRLRLMDEGKSFFLITDHGLVFEYICIESAWIWLRHESSTAMRGILSNYNGSLFMVNAHGNLLLRERSGKELSWRNCTAVRKGRNVIGGQPWDGLPGQEKVATEDTLFFVSKNGKLMKLMVSMKKLKWKDCRNPPDAKVACIVDQELFRKNIVFVIGRNGRLYQYNKVTDLWHEHYHSQHLVLSQFPGTVIRPSLKTLSGSLFMLSREGGLVEYQWSSLYGWNWVEHGTPNRGVTLVGSPGPGFEGNQLFLIGSDGKVYLRYMDKKAWKWKDCGFPYVGNNLVEAPRHGGFQKDKVDCIDEDSTSYLKKYQGKIGDLNIKCDSKVAPTRPIPFSEASVIFELRDGRLAEIQLVEKTEWVWSRIIGTPASLCLENYWSTVAYNLS
ncbi:uncharacterized protein LOC109810841 isoform X2 [Cajanus cajan]|uniref:uncharacterized protein LOC109810841 isoform X2 n=1 Tax=Cajanus cajan TaxID=3821 RepID=UPI00098DB959|nr:uncharacterized protein LOC109810841 isoform X2 [Cajanus cajan]